VWKATRIKQQNSLIKTKRFGKRTYFQKMAGDIYLSSLLTFKEAKNVPNLSDVRNWTLWRMVGQLALFTCV